MDPLLIDVPVCLRTPRLLLRCPRPGDGPALNQALCASLADLRPWMDWAQTAPSIDDSEIVARRGQARFLLREDLVYFIFDRRADDSEGACLGGTGLHRMDWRARRFEIGYWRRSGHEGRGLIGEAVHALQAMAIGTLGARRLEIRTDDDNHRSARVAERAGFTLEGVLRDDGLTPQGQLRSTRVYARCVGSGLSSP